MSRTVVYPSSGTSRRAAVRGDPPPDGYRDKIAKYVPAETLAFFVPIAAQATTDGTRRLILVVGAFGTVLYLFLGRKSRPYFYVLALIAYFAWALGTSDFGAELFGLDDNLSRIILAIAVFLIPGIDEAITKIWPTD
jgi:uncharacterized membrane protein YphA (DoxX/SURF4 family)